MGLVFEIIDFLVVSSGNWKALLIWIGLLVAFFGLVFLMAPRGPAPTPPRAAASAPG